MLPIFSRRDGLQIQCCGHRSSSLSFINLRSVLVWPNVDGQLAVDFVLPYKPNGSNKKSSTNARMTFDIFAVTPSNVGARVCLNTTLRRRTLPSAALVLTVKQKMRRFYRPVLSRPLIEKSGPSRLRRHSFTASPSRYPWMFSSIFSSDP